MQRVEGVEFHPLKEAFLTAAALLPMLVMPERTKNYGSRLIPLSDYAMHWLSRLVRHISCPYVFVNSKTGERLKWPDKTFRRVTAELGFPIGFHDLRCFRATRWARMGVDLNSPLAPDT